MYLLGRNEEINQWLEDNPAVLGGGAIVLGLILLGFGVTALMTGKSTSKYGQKLEGTSAYAHGGILTLAGVGACLFGLYKLVAGMF